jgi:hypothetical protein
MRNNAVLKTKGLDCVETDDFESQYHDEKAQCSNIVRNGLPDIIFEFSADAC